MSNEKSSIVRIDLKRVEGRLAQAEAKTFTEANRVLSQWSGDAPKVGYDKVEVRFEWANGMSLLHRVDLKHFSCNEFVYLEGDLQGYIDAWLGNSTWSGVTPQQAEFLLAKYREQGLDKIASTLQEQCELSDIVELQPSRNSENVLSRNAVVDILKGQRENCDTSRIGFYETLDSLVDKVIGSKSWSSGEVFVFAESSDRFVVMKQVAPSSCEMLTITNAGYHDVLTAYRYPRDVLIQELNACMMERSEPRETSSAL